MRQALVSRAFVQRHLAVPAQQFVQPGKVFAQQHRGVEHGGVFGAAAGVLQLLRVKALQNEQTTGPQASGQALVRSGLKTGDEIAVRGTAALKGAWQGLGPAVDSKEP